METPLGPMYIPYTYMDPLGKPLQGSLGLVGQLTTPPKTGLESIRDPIALNVL